MRTTLTVDDDLLDHLKSEAVRLKRPFREVVNETLRRGLNATIPDQSNYELPIVDLGYPPRMDYDHALSLAERLEDDEIVHKMSLNK